MDNHHTIGPCPPSTTDATSEGTTSTWHSREREREKTRTHGPTGGRHGTARQTNHHSVKRTLIDPGDIDPSRVQAQGCRARAGVLARMRQVPHPYGLTK